LKPLGGEGGLQVEGMHGVDEVDQAGVDMVVVGGEANVKVKQVGCVIE